MKEGVHDFKIGSRHVIQTTPLLLVVFIHWLRLNDNKAMYQFEVCPPPHCDC